MQFIFRVDARLDLPIVGCERLGDVALVDRLRAWLVGEIFEFFQERFRRELVLAVKVPLQVESIAALAGCVGVLSENRD